MLPKEGYEVVISGIGGKFPETNNISELQEKLFNKENLVTVDARRWPPGNRNTPKATGKCLEEFSYDAAFFGVHRKLCTAAEPIMKLTMERCFEAMVDAGVNPFTLRGSNIAVLIGTMNSESEILQLTHYELISNGFGILGHSQTLSANRVSYFFNFVGPSYAVNSGVGGTLVLEKAAEMIRQGRVTAALVTSAYLMWTPVLSKEYRDLNLLTFETKARPFDARADGFIRSDGVVTYFLQRKEDANRIYATVENVATNSNCGRDAPYLSCRGIEGFLSKFYEDAGINPSSVSYLEPEGLAVKNFDTEELNSVAKVFCKDRKSPLLIGTIKGNTGYSHVASSYMSLAKVLISMEQGTIPATLNYEIPNPEVPALENGTLKVVTEHTELPGELVAVNNVFVCGLLGHILVRRHNKVKRLTQADSLPRLVLASARHEEGANNITDKLRDMPLDQEFISLVNNVHKTSIPNHLYRTYSILSTEKVHNEISFCDSDKQKPLWFVFSGMGSHWPGMGRDLLNIPVFAAAIEKCDKVLKPKGVDIKYIITSEDPKVFDNILHCFVGIAAIQVGLVDILRTIGLQPDGIIGHSAGELGCAYADDCFTAEQMVLCAWARGRASLDNPLIRGQMAAVGLGYNDIKNMLPASVDVACHNAKDSSTISGPYDDVHQVTESLKAKSVFVKSVNTSEIAFHSRYINPVAESLNKMLREVVKTPKCRSNKWISTSVPKTNWECEEAKFASAAYYTNNLINPVLFEEGCAFIPKDAIVLEIAPHGLMQAILRRSLSSNAVNISLTNRSSESNVENLLGALGKLYLNKVDIDVNALYPKVDYPVSRGTPSLAPLASWDHSDVWFTDFVNTINMITADKSEIYMEFDDNHEKYDLWAQNQIGTETIIPLAQILSYSWQLIAKKVSVKEESLAVQFEDVVLTDRVVIKPTKQELLVSLMRGSGKFEACLERASDSHKLVTGVLTTVKKPQIVVEKLASNGHFGIRVSRSELYSVLSQHHHQVGPSFQLVSALHVKDKDFKALICWPGDMVLFLEALFKLVLFINLRNKETIVQIQSFRKLIVDFPKLFSITEGSEVEVWYNSKTDQMYCEGLLMEGIKTTSQTIDKTNASSLVWRSVKFVPYSENISTMEKFVNIGIQLIAEEGLNSWSNKVANFVSLEVRDSTNKPFFISKYLQDTFKSMTNIMTRLQVRDIQKAKEDLKQIGQKTCLVIGDYQILQPLINSESDQCHVFYLTLIPNETYLEERMFSVALLHQMKQGNLVLLKKKSDASKLRVFELDWMAGLRQFMDHNNGQSVVVVSRHWQQRQALKTLALETYAHKLRCVFLDKQAPQFCLNSPLFSEQLSLGFTVNVLQGKTWGSYRAIDLPNVPSNFDTSAKFDSSSKNLQITHLSLNTRTLSLSQQLVPNDQVAMNYLDFCGMRKNSEKVMGIAKYDQKNKRVIPDPLLTWTVPPQWSMEDAVTVPFTYSLAYYSLILKAKLERGESVLVHAGMSPVGQAAIAVSLYSGANVFATVNSGQEVAGLLNTFPQINPAQVIVFENQNRFDLELRRLTKDSKVNVVINCLTGKDIFATLQCLGLRFRFIHLGDIILKEDQTIGMIPFLKWSSMYGVSLDNIVNAEPDCKKSLKMMLDNGIKSGTIRPLKRKTFSVLHKEDAIKNLKEKSAFEKTILVKPEVKFKNALGYQCNPDESFIVLGTKQGLWLELSEWLLKNGARRLVIASLKQNLTTNVSRKFNNLMIQHRATIVMTTISRLDTLRSSEEFVQEAIRMGPVAGIFCTYMEEKSIHLQNLDTVSRQLIPDLKLFACLLGGGANICESRAQTGHSACLVQADSSLSLPLPSIFLSQLSVILAMSSRKATTFLISEPSSTARLRGTLLSVQEVGSNVPASLEELEALGQVYNSANSFTLQELPTLGLRHQFTRYKLLPIFLLPGQDVSRLLPLSRNLMHPTFSPTVIPTFPSILNPADFLLKEMVAVQKQGPYNLVGECWSSGLALQLATMLEADGHTVELFLLDSTPANDSLQVKPFCQPMGHFNPVLFLTTLLSLSSSVSKNLAQLENWEDQVDLALSELKLPITDEYNKENIVTALTVLRDRLQEVLKFDMPEKLFKGNLHLLRTSSASDTDYCGLKKLCKRTPTIHITEDASVCELLNNPKTAAIINEQVAFTWKM